MMYLVGILLCAALFVLFGALRPRTECNGGGCGACGGVCSRHDESGESHHE
jgi:hypothetical protein